MLKIVKTTKQISFNVFNSNPYFIYKNLICIIKLLKANKNH